MNRADAGKILKSSQGNIDHYCGYCLAEKKIVRALYRTRNNVPVCRDWQAKSSHKMYIHHVLTEITPSKGSAA